MYKTINAADLSDEQRQTFADAFASKGTVTYEGKTWKVISNHKGDTEYFTLKEA